MWVVSNGDNNVMKLAPSTSSVVSTYATGKGPFAVVFDGAKIGCRTSQAIRFLVRQPISFELQITRMKTD